MEIDKYRDQLSQDEFIRENIVQLVYLRNLDEGRRASLSKLAEKGLTSPWSSNFGSRGIITTHELSDSEIKLIDTLHEVMVSKAVPIELDLAQRED